VTNGLETFVDERFLSIKWNVAVYPDDEAERNFWIGTCFVKSSVTCKYNSASPR
jgi:hypothetical protein